MTDPHSPTPDETAPDEDRVRALLAESRVTEPMPPEVAARLEDVLGELVGARTAPIVVPLRPRWRQRTARGLVVAAAVLIVGGGTMTLLQHRDQSSGGASGSAADSATSSMATDTPGSADLGKRSPQPLRNEVHDSAGALGAQSQKSRQVLPSLSSAHFADGVRHLVTTTAADRAGLSGLTATAAQPAPEYGAAVADCARPIAVPADRLSRDDVLTVSLDGALATLVVEPVGSDPRTATAYSCDGKDVLATTTLRR